MQVAGLRRGEAKQGGEAREAGEGSQNPRNLTCRDTEAQIMAMWMMTLTGNQHPEKLQQTATESTKNANIFTIAGLCGTLRRRIRREMLWHWQ